RQDQVPSGFHPFRWRAAGPDHAFTRSLHMYIHLHPAVVVRAATLACATAIAPLAMAADPAPSTARLLSGVPLPPEVQSENGIEYLTGGVSIDGRAQLPPLVRDMNLQLVFAEKQ